MLNSLVTENKSALILMLQLVQELIDAKVSFAEPVHLQLIHTPLISLKLFIKRVLLVREAALKLLSLAKQPH